MTGGKLTNQIRTLRFLKGEMSQADLGQAIGVTRQTIAAIEAARQPSLVWALERGSRSGRVAWQFSKHWAGLHAA